jgi:hypothetical protein
MFFEEYWSPTLIGHTKSRAVYTALQGKFDATLTGMEKYRNGKGQRFVIHQALFVSIDCSDY